MRTSVVKKHGLTEVTLLHTDHASDQSFIVCSTGIRYIRVVNAAVIARSLSKRNKDRHKGVDDPYKIDDLSKVAYLYCRRKHVQGDPIVFWLKLLQNRQRFPLGDVEDWKVRQRLCSYVSDSHSGKRRQKRRHLSDSHAAGVQSLSGGMVVANRSLPISQVPGCTHSTR